MKQKIKYVLALLVLFAFQNWSSLRAQVTIGSNDAPQRDAVLDLRSNDLKGLLLPRLALVATNNNSPLNNHVQGMVVYNTVYSGSGSTAVTPGYYYNDGQKWNRITPNAPNFFYSPSIPIPISTVTTGSIDLYTNYTSQFSAPLSKNPSAAASIPVYANTDLSYYVTWYDQNIFDTVTITDAGVLNYNVRTGADTSTPTYMNVVFVVK